MNIKLGLILKYSPVLINLDTAEMDFQEVLEVVQRRLDQYRNGLMEIDKNE